MMRRHTVIVERSEVWTYHVDLLEEDDQTPEARRAHEAEARLIAGARWNGGERPDPAVRIARFWLCSQEVR